MMLENSGTPPEPACNISNCDPAAVTSSALAPSPYTTPLSVNDDLPVPPFATVRSFANVTVPDTSKLPSRSK